MQDATRAHIAQLAQLALLHMCAWKPSSPQPLTDMSQLRVLVLHEAAIGAVDLVALRQLSQLTNRR